MRVLAEVRDDLLGSAEGTLAVDPPVFAVQTGDERGKTGPVSNPQDAGSLGSPQSIEHLAPEQPAHDVHREQVIGLGSDPSIAIVVERAACHDAVRVRVKLEFLGPRVQHRGNTQLTTEAFRILAELEKGLGCAAQKQVVDERRIVPAQASYSEGSVNTM